MSPQLLFDQSVGIVGFSWILLQSFGMVAFDLPDLHSILSYRRCGVHVCITGPTQSDISFAQT